MYAIGKKTVPASKAKGIPAKEIFQSIIFAEEAMLLNTSTSVNTTVMMSKYL
jgi:hypothetical protein